MNSFLLVLAQKISSHVQYLFSFPFTDEEGERGRETVQHISTLICKSNVLVKDGELHTACLDCEK
jgi:hypothetical protein